jgi:hypothetical protein
MNYREALDEMVELAPNQGMMVNLDESGDTKIIWDRTKKVEVDMAREVFKKARKEGYMSYKVTGKDGAKGEIMHEFDPEAERIILAPPLQGGTR